MLPVTWAGGLISSLYSLPMLDRPLCLILGLRGRRRRRKMSTRESIVTDGTSCLLYSDQSVILVCSTVFSQSRWLSCSSWASSSNTSCSSFRHTMSISFFLSADIFLSFLSNLLPDSHTLSHIFVVQIQIVLAETSMSNSPSVLLWPWCF